MCVFEAVSSEAALPSLPLLADVEHNNISLEGVSFCIKKAWAISRSVWTYGTMSLGGCKRSMDPGQPYLGVFAREHSYRTQITKPCLEFSDPF